MLSGAKIKAYMIYAASSEYNLLGKIENIKNLRKIQIQY